MIRSQTVVREEGITAAVAEKCRGTDEGTQSGSTLHPLCVSAVLLFN
jgi:hypothetical protein